MYESTTDISPSCCHVGVVSQCMNRPLTPHLIVVKQILRYLWGIIELGIHFEKGIWNEITGFTNANWVGDYKKKQSTSKYVF
jgi:hypothetical protein